MLVWEVTKSIFLLPVWYFFQFCEKHRLLIAYHIHIWHLTNICNAWNIPNEQRFSNSCPWSYVGYSCPLSTNYSWMAIAAIAAQWLSKGRRGTWKHNRVFTPTTLHQSPATCRSHDSRRINFTGCWIRPNCTSSRCPGWRIGIWYNETWTIWPSFCKRHFHTNFLANDQFKFPCSFSPRVQLKYVIIGSGNGSVPNRQWIAWVNDDTVPWRIPAGISAGPSVINVWLMSKYMWHQGCVSTLQQCHNERDGVSYHRRLQCLLNRLFRCKSKKTSKLRVTGLCEGITM